MKPIIILGKKLHIKKNRICVQYDKDVSSYVPNFSKPLKFHSDGFMDGVVP